MTGQQITRQLLTSYFGLLPLMSTRKTGDLMYVTVCSMENSRSFLIFGPHGSHTRSPVDERQARALEAPSHACAVTVGRGHPAYVTDRPRQ